jgi:hypothetical protein
MHWRRWLAGGLVGASLLAPTCALGDERAIYNLSFRPQPEQQSGAMPRVPLESLAPAMRERVAHVLERPAFTSKGPSETFQAEGHVYRWLLEHPDMAVKLWKQIGAKVSEIHDRGDGVFVWRDENQGEVNWHTAIRAPGLHVWYAEGKIKPAALIPMTSFRAVAIMTYHEGKDTKGKDAIRHQVHFLLRCDSRAVSLAMKLMGASAPRMAEQYLGQLQMFYGGMAWYLGQDAERAKTMYKKAGLSVPE